MSSNLKEHYEDTVFALFPRHRFFTLALLVFLIEHVRSFHFSPNAISSPLESFWSFLFSSNIKSLFDSTDGLFYNVSILSIALSALALVLCCLVVRWIQSGIFDFFMLSETIKSRITKIESDAQKEKTKDSLLNIQIARNISEDLDAFRNEMKGYSYIEEIILVAIFISVYSLYHTGSLLDKVAIAILIVSYMALCLYVTFFYFTKILPRSIRHEELLKP